jgi:hypothetical protein
MDSQFVIQIYWCRNKHVLGHSPGPPSGVDVWDGSRGRHTHPHLASNVSPLLACGSPFSLSSAQDRNVTPLLRSVRKGSGRPRPWAPGCRSRNPSRFDEPSLLSQLYVNHRSFPPPYTTETKARSETRLLAVYLSHCEF